MKRPVLTRFFKNGTRMIHNSPAEAVGAGKKNPRKTLVLRGLKAGANSGIRTQDLRITNALLYQLS